MRISFLTRFVTHLAFLVKTQLTLNKKQKQNQQQQNNPPKPQNTEPKHFLWDLTKARIKESQKTEKLLEFTTIFWDEKVLI